MIVGYIGWLKPGTNVERYLACVGLLEKRCGCRYFDFNPIVAY
jgi:hypothetical protein